MTNLPRDPTERHKLALLSDLHHQLVSYRNAEDGRNPADTNRDLTVDEELHTFYPELPHQAAPGKTFTETVLEEWLEPRVRQTLEKLDPRRIKTPTQAHVLQGVLAYYYTYIQEYLSARQIIDAKMRDAQSICDTWCSITGSKRFVVNKTLESLLSVKSPRTVQRYVPQGMVTTFGISFGSARSGKKSKTPPKGSPVGHAPANGVTVPTLEGPGPHSLFQSNIARLLNESIPSTLDAERLDGYLAAIGDVHKAVSSATTFTAIAQFMMQIPEVVYSESRLFGPFVFDLSQYQPDSIDDRLDTVELREQLRSHPVVEHVLAAKHQQRLQFTRAGELQVAQQLCTNLTQRSHNTADDGLATIAQLCVIVVGRLDDAEFTKLVALTFDRLPGVYQMALVSRLIEDCRPHAFDLAASLAAHSSGGFVRSRVRYLAHLSRTCPDHLAHAQSRLSQILEPIGNGDEIAPEIGNARLFLESYIEAFGLAMGPQIEITIDRHTGSGEN